MFEFSITIQYLAGSEIKILTLRMVEDTPLQAIRKATELGLGPKVYRVEITDSRCITP